MTKLPVRYGESTNPDPGRLGLRIRRRCTFCSRILSFDPQVLSFLKLPLLLCPGTCCKIDHLHNEKSHRITTPSSTTNLSTPLHLNTSESNIVACSKLCSKAASSQGDAEVAIDRLNRTRQPGFRELVSLHVFDRGNPHFSLIKRSHSTQLFKQKSPSPTPFHVFSGTWEGQSPGVTGEPKMNVSKEPLSMVIGVEIQTLGAVPLAPWADKSLQSQGLWLWWLWWLSWWLCRFWWWCGGCRGGCGGCCGACGCDVLTMAYLLPSTAELVSTPVHIKTSAPLRTSLVTKITSVTTLWRLKAEKLGSRAAFHVGLCQRVSKKSNFKHKKKHTWSIITSSFYTSTLTPFSVGSVSTCLKHIYISHLENTEASKAVVSEAKFASLYDLPKKNKMWPESFKFLDTEYTLEV